MNNIMKTIKLVILMMFLTLTTFSQTVSKVYHEGNSELTNLEAEKSSLNEINIDYKNGKKLIGEYYDLVYKAIEEERPELFEEAIAKAKQAKILFGHAYTKEKTYQGVHPESYSPITLKEQSGWLKLADGLIDGSHIKNLQALVKQNEVSKSQITPFTDSPESGYNHTNFWIYGISESCSEFYSISDCSSGCLKMKVCLVSETEDKVTIKVEVLPTNRSVCFGGSNKKPITIYYGGHKIELSRNVFIKEGYRTEAFTISKKVNSSSKGVLIWDSKKKLYKKPDGRYNSSEFIIVRC